MLLLEIKTKFDDPILDLKFQNIHDRVELFMRELHYISTVYTLFNISTKPAYLRFTLKELMERIELEKSAYRTHPISNRKDPIFGFAERSILPFVDIVKFNKLPQDVICQAPRRGMVLRALKVLDKVEKYKGKSFGYILDDISLEELIAIEGMGDVTTLEFFKFIRILGHSCK